MERGGHKGPGAWRGDVDGGGVDLGLLTASEAVQQRQRRYWRRQEEREATTLVGLLVTLAEAEAEVTVHVDGDLRVTGRLLEVGTDVAVMQDRAGRTTIIALGKVTSLGAAAGTEVTGDRPSPLAVRFAERVAELSADEPDVSIHLGSGDPVVGRLRWTGQDVCCVTPLGLGAGRTPTYVALSAVCAVTVTG